MSSPRSVHSLLVETNPKCHRTDYIQFPMPVKIDFRSELHLSHGFKLARNPIYPFWRPNRPVAVQHWYIVEATREIAGAVRAITKLGGGFVAVLGGVIGSARLDVTGCVSLETYGKVRDDSLAYDSVVHHVLCSKMKVPFMIASFVGLVGVPDLGLTELGLIDCKTQGLMDIVLSDDMAEKQGDSINIPTPSKYAVDVRAMHTMFTE